MNQRDCSSAPCFRTSILSGWYPTFMGRWPFSSGCKRSITMLKGRVDIYTMDIQTALPLLEGY